MTAERKRRTPPSDAPHIVAPEGLEYRRGDIIWINCDPSVGAEPRKTRSCVVASNDIANHYGQAVTVLPTQKYTAERAARAYMVDLRSPRSSLKAARVANASMVMTYDRSRVIARAGHVAPQTQARIDEAIAMHLGLNKT